MNTVTIVAGLLGSGGVGALLAFRKTAAESEAISVKTMRGVIAELKAELSRKDELISKQDRQIARLNSRLRKLEVLAGLKPGDTLD